MIIALLNSLDYPCPRTHYLHVKKFLTGFAQNGYSMIEIKSLHRIDQLSENDILYISSHFSIYPIYRHAKFLENRLFNALKKTKCKIIFWNFHTTLNILRWKSFDERSIHVSEDIYDEYVHEEKLLFDFRECYNVHNLRYSSILTTDIKIPLDLIERDYIFQFVGSNYKNDFTTFCKNNYKSFIKITPPSIDEIIRINSFRKSKINLVFHSNANIKKGIIVERFPEAISYGGIILHDHPRIVEKFENIESFFYIKDLDDLVDVYEKISSLSENDLSNMREISYKTWVKSNLSYKYEANKIIIKLFNIEENHE